MLAQTPADGSPSGLVKDTTTAGFRQDVIAESMNQPVLVDFWAPWCGPCRQLTPVLETAGAAAGGKVKLVKMNIDEHPSIAGQLGVQSIPAVFAFSGGRPIDGFMGALPDSQVQEFIARLLGADGADETEALLAEASERSASGDLAGTAELYAAVLDVDPGNAQALAALAKLHVELGDLEAAHRFLDMVEPADATRPDVAGARAALALAEQTGALDDVGDLQRRVEADPQDHASRFDLALALAARNERSLAVEQLLDIIKRDRAWNEDGARKQLVQFFEAWGPVDPATLSGRRKLSSVLFA